MEPDLGILTSTAATTLVQLMTTDAWDRFKASIVSLWRRVHPERADTVDAELAAARLEVLAAGAALAEQARLDLADEWRSRLRPLVAAEPQLADDLRRLVEEFRPVLAEAEASRPGAVRMKATASGHGRVYQAAGDQHIVER